MASIIARFKWQWRAIFALSLTVASTSLAFAAVSLIQLSTDPYTNSSSQHQTEVQPDVFSFGSTLVAAFQVARFPAPKGGSDNIGWATSTDGGQSWTHGFLSGITVYAGGSFARVTAPSVIYDAKHQVWLIASQPDYPISKGGGAAQVVSRSTDGGLTWSKPFTVTDLGPKVLLDKDWITCDNTATSPFYGHCYEEFDNHTQGNLILMNTSTDGGLTWQGAQPTVNNDIGLGGQPLVEPNGTVVVPMDNANRTAVLVFSSIDGGLSWGQASVIQQIVSHKEHGGLRSRAFISAAIDGAGKVYVVWQDCRFETNCSANDLVMSTRLMASPGLQYSAFRLTLSAAVSTTSFQAWVWISPLRAARLISGWSTTLIAFRTVPFQAVNWMWVLSHPPMVERPLPLPCH